MKRIALIADVPLIRRILAIPVKAAMNKHLIESTSFCPAMKKIKKVMSGTSWALIGGRAVEVHTNPPQTPDIDILCDAFDVDAYELIDSFKSIGIVPTMPYEEGDIIFLIDKELDVEIDVLPTYDAFDVRAIKRAKNASCNGVKFPVVQPEDLIIMKAQAASSAGGGMMGRSKEKVKHDMDAIRTLIEEVDLNDDYIVKVLRSERWFDELRLLRKLGL
jgi:predicted nucleotidyltransferase